MKYILALCATILAFMPLGYEAYAAPQKQQKKPAAAPQLRNSMDTGESFLSGKVVEFMNSGGYTYVCLEKKGEKTWVAVPEMKVLAGQEMSFLPGQEMPNFTSKSLGRTFDSIVFSSGPASAPQAGSGGLPPGHENITDQKSGSKSAASPLSKDILVEKATGPNAYTVGEIFEKRTALHKKTVLVKGKVVKVSAEIMGKNWIHLQDGTGNPKKSTHNLVITSDDLPSVGDVITVKGVIFKNKDFGAGYKYEVIMETGSIQR